LAARSLRKQVKQLAEHLDGVRLGEDIESIHRARVASRRLRAALGMFRACWKRKQVKQWKKQIRQLARNLGKARDHDVLIKFLASSLTGVSDRAVAPGIACLLDHVAGQRQWIQPRVIEAVDRFEAGGALKTMQAAIRQILDEAGDAEFVASEYVCGQAGKSVRKRLKQLLDEAPGLADPEQIGRHHAMRIAAKRLRYTLELARPVYSRDSAGSDPANPVDAVKRLQTLLGEIHDCDVWVENFAEFARMESREIPLDSGSLQRFERLRPGLDYLRQERMARRRQVFDELVAFWQQRKDLGVWDRLATIILEWGDAGAKTPEASPDSSPAEVSSA